MNNTLIRSFRANSWSQLEGFLSYLREKGCFYSIAGKPKANPYWYGTIFDFIKGEAEIKELLKSKSLKLSRLKEIANSAKEDNNSPIVRLVGLTVARIVKSEINERQ